MANTFSFLSDFQAQWYNILERVVSFNEQGENPQLPVSVSSRFFSALTRVPIWSWQGSLFAGRDSGRQICENLPTESGQIQILKPKAVWFLRV